MNTTTMNEKKITKAQKFAMLLALDEVKSNPMLVEFINHEVELLARKNTAGEKKPTKVQQANVTLQTAIYEKMEENRLYSVGEIQKEIPECAELTNQKVSAMLRALKAEGKVERTEEKGKPFYQVVR